MQRYEFKVVPAPRRGLKTRGAKTTEDRFAAALEALMNDLGAQGWDYVRSDTLPVEERQGLTGRSTTYQAMLVFRRARDAVAQVAPAALAAPVPLAPAAPLAAMPGPVAPGPAAGPAPVAPMAPAPAPAAPPAPPPTGLPFSASPVPAAMAAGPDPFSVPAPLVLHESLPRPAPPVGPAVGPAVGSALPPREIS